MSSSEMGDTQPRDEHDQRLVRRIRHGSKPAFEKLFRRYCDDLCVFAERYVSSSAVAEDLVHDVFCDVWNRRSDFHPEGTVKAYLFQAVRNKAYNQLKRRRVRREWQAEKKREVGSVVANAARSAENDDLKDALYRAVESLPERQRTVFSMAYHHDLSYAEIAAILGITRKTVENHMGRALKRLRDRLAPFLSSLCAFLGVAGLC